MTTTVETHDAAEAQADPVMAGGGFALLRIAALPLDAIEALRLPGCEELIDRRLNAEIEMENVRQAVEDAIHDLVPRLAEEEHALRRAALGLRRNVHNGRRAKIKPALLAEMQERLGERRDALDRWMAARNEADAALDGLAEKLPLEIQDSLRPAVRAPLSDPNFRRALEFANPGMERTAATEKKLPKTMWPNSLERALLGYIGRAAVKTSPFSSFMILSVIPADPEADTPWPAAESTDYHHRVNLNRGVVTRLDRAGLVEMAKTNRLPLMSNDTLWRGLKGRVLGLCNREIVLIGRPWYEQRLGQFKLPPALIEALLEEREGTWDDWRRVILEAGIAEGQAEGVLAKLVERGLVLPRPMTDAFDPAPLDSLKQRWAESGSDTLRKAVARLDHLGDLTRTVTDSSGPERIAAIDNLRAVEQSALKDVGAPAPAADSEDAFQNLVLEDCWVDGVKGTLGRDLMAPLRDLEDFLATQVIVSPYYERLVEVFLERYGEGATCTDAVSFLLSAADRLVDIPEFGAQMQLPESNAAPRGVSIPVTAHVQIAADPAGGPARLAVNRVFEGAGWLAARFTPGDHSAQGLLRERLSRWLNDLSNPREPVDVVIGGHCSDLQAHSPLTRRVVRWPGEPLLMDPERIIEANDLRLTHNRETGLLDVTDKAGTPLSLHYLGATLPSPIWGVRYALTILTQPYLLKRPDTAPPREGENEHIQYEPGLTHGQAVLRRPRWWISSEYLYKHWLSGTEAERLVNVSRDCRRHGIPPRFFAQRYIAPEPAALLPADILDANRKPLWCDVRNPFWLALLDRLAKHADWVSLTEPLPGPDELWLTLNGQRHVSELHFEMTVRARPSE